jgi:hypothetical protein
MFTHPYIGSHLGRQRHREMLAQAGRQRLGRCATWPRSPGARKEPSAASFVPFAQLYGCARNTVTVHESGRPGKARGPAALI